MGTRASDGQRNVQVLNMDRRVHGNSGALRAQRWILLQQAHTCRLPVSERPSSGKLADGTCVVHMITPLRRNHMQRFEPQLVMLW